MGTVRKCNTKSAPRRGDKRMTPHVESVLVSLRRIIRATDLHSRRLALAWGLTIPQIVALQSVKDLGEVTSGKLAKHMSLSLSTTTTILDRLETRGFIERYRNIKDRRVVHGRLTPEGRKVLRKVPTPLQEQFIERFSQLSGAEQTRIVSTLEEVAEMMGAEDLDAAPVLDVGPLVEQGPAKSKG